MTINSKRTLSFIGITFLLSWVLAGIFALCGGVWTSKSAYPVTFLYMIIPGLAALVVQKFIAHEPLRKSLAICFKPNLWFLAAWIIPAFIALSTSEVGLELPWHEYTPDMSGYFERMAGILTPQQIEQMRMAADKLPFPLFWFSFIGGMIGGITITALFALGQELGWRGFLQRQFSSYGFWKASGMIGLIWGLWQTPIVLMGYNYPEHPIAGVGMIIIFTLLLSPIMSYLRLRSKSVIASSIFLGTLNGLASIPLFMISGGSDLTAGITGLAGFIVLAGVLGGIVIFERFFTDQAIIFPMKPE
ncbi:MAG: CPBP family glutamic-type intramembrane protease [Candidatus Latescibacterota bacterium]